MVDAAYPAMGALRTYSRGLQRSVRRSKLCESILPWFHLTSQFRGDMAGNAGEDALAKDIAEAGQAWARTHWRQEDMTAYVFRLYLEWGRLLAPNRSSRDFTYQESMEAD